MILSTNDTNLFCSDNNIRPLFETANQELNQINGWFLAKRLPLNIEKTKYVLFHKVTGQDNIPLKMSSLQLNGNIIERVNITESLKFLAVVLDEQITRKKHIQIIENKVSKMLAFFINLVN